MGVPVVTLAGGADQPAVTRAGATILNHLRLSDLLAGSEEQYLNIAIALAGAPAHLTELRQTLRDRLRASPLMDEPRFARTFENALRAMWRDWCDRMPA